MNYLSSHVAGQWFYLNLILDLYSRNIIGWEVHAQDSSEHAAPLVYRTTLAEGITLNEHTHRPVLHGDNGSTLKATSVLAMLHWLGIKPSYSRYLGGVKTLEGARQWESDIVHWYNFNHRHSGIRYVSPAQRHAGEDRQILARRHEVYQAARKRHPARWSRHTRNWTPIEAVALNPERDAVVNLAIQSQTLQRSATA